MDPMDPATDLNGVDDAAQFVAQPSGEPDLSAALFVQDAPEWGTDVPSNVHTNKLYPTSCRLSSADNTSILNGSMDGSDPAPEAFPARVQRLAAQRGITVTRLARLAHHEADEAKGTSPEMIRKVMAGDRVLTRTVIEAVARTLDVDPDEFPEYRLALARRLFDEREVGLEKALQNLSQLEAELQAGGVVAGAAPASRRKPRPTKGPPGNPRKGPGR
jgi:hypothetical protein